MKISFDFDCTLGEAKIQHIAKLLLRSEGDCYIVTSRNSKGHSNIDLFNVAKRLGIIEDRIYFTESGFKWRKIKELGIDIHFDDVPEECELITMHTDCLALLLWDEFCKDSIKHDSFGKGIY